MSCSIGDVARTLGLKKYRHMELSLKDTAAQFSSNGGGPGRLRCQRPAGGYHPLCL